MNKKMLGVLLGVILSSLISGLGWSATVIVTNKMIYSNTVTVASGIQDTNGNPIVNTDGTIAELNDPYIINTNIIVFNATNDMTFAISNNNSQISIGSYLFHLNDTNAMGFSKTAKLWLYTTNSYAMRDARWYFTGLKFAGSLYTNTLNIGTNLILVQDATDFSTNDMIWLTGLTNEYARISGITNTQLTTYEPLTLDHTVSGGVARVVEIGGFRYINKQMDNKLYGRIIFTNATTVNIKGQLEYTK